MDLLPRCCPRAQRPSIPSKINVKSCSEPPKANTWVELVNMSLKKVQSPPPSGKNQYQVKSPPINMQVVNPNGKKSSKKCGKKPTKVQSSRKVWSHHPKASKGSTLTQSNAILHHPIAKKGWCHPSQGVDLLKESPNLLKSGVSHLKIMMMRLVKYLKHMTSENGESNLGLANPSNVVAAINDDLAPL